MLADLSILVGIILNRHFRESRCVLQVGEKESLIKIENFPMYIFTEDTASLNYKESERCEGFVINRENSSGILDELEAYIQRNSEVRYNNRMYIFYLPSGDLNWMYNSYLLRYISNAVFIKYVDFRDKFRDNYFELYTHKYVGLSDNNAPVLQDKWFPNNASFHFENNLFPNKITNQYGRVLNVITADYIPYSHWGSRTGVELKSILEFGAVNNITLNITVTDLWGKIYSNWTGFGILGSVVMDLYDVGFGALFALPDRIIYSDYTKPTVFSQVSCIVPAPQLEDSWFTPIKVFSFNIWALIITAYIFLGITVYIARTIWCSRKSNTIYFMPLSLIGIFVSNPIPKTQVPSVDRLRYVFAMVLIMTVISSALYCSRLASVLVAPKYVNEIKTVEDLAKSNILWGELQEDWVIPLYNDYRPLYKIIKNKFRVFDENKLHKLSQTNNFAFGIERLLSGYFAIGPYFKPDAVSKYVVMPEDLYRQYTCMQLRKNSVLLPSLNLFLIRLSETGLLNYWEGETSRAHLDYKVQKGLMTGIKEEYIVSLKMVHLKGAFLMLGLGLVLAFVMFLHELERQYFAKKRLL